MLRLLVVYCFLSAIIWECKSIDESCDLTENGQTVPGICINIRYCPDLLTLIRVHGHKVKWCPNGKKMQIVCCPKKVDIKIPIVPKTISAQSIYKVFTKNCYFTKKFSFNRVSGICS